jgi:hypothetical protein
LHRILRRFRVLWRVESVIAEMRLHAIISRYVLYVFATLIAAFGLGMLNIAAFFSLEPLWGPMWAALIGALGDFVFAVLIAGIALAVRPSSELSTALELRQASIDGIEAELDPLQERFVWLGRIAHDPLDAAMPAILVPLITAIVRGLRKKTPKRDDAA